MAELSVGFKRMLGLATPLGAREPNVLLNPLFVDGTDPILARHSRRPSSRMAGDGAQALTSR